MLSQIAFYVGLTSVLLQISEVLVGERLRETVHLWASRIETFFYNLLKAQWVRFFVNPVSLFIALLPALLFAIVYTWGPIGFAIYTKSWLLGFGGILHLLITGKGFELAGKLLKGLEVEQMLDELATQDSVLSYLKTFAGLLLGWIVILAVYAGFVLIALCVVDFSEEGLLGRIAGYFLSMFTPVILAGTLCIIGLAIPALLCLLIPPFYGLAKIARFVSERICLYSGGSIQALLSLLTGIGFFVSFIVK